MPKINVVVHHDLPENVAAERIRSMIPTLKQQFSGMVTDLNETWTGKKGQFSFKVKGMDVNGEIEVKENKVIVDGEIPLLALPFKGRIEDTIKEQAAILLK
jgi:hypothetical protein